jgi:hypothetical protein
MKPLSERLLEDVGYADVSLRLYEAIIEAAALAKSVESAPVVTVDPLTHGGFGVIVTARDMIGQRVALVPLPQQSET